MPYELLCTKLARRQFAELERKNPEKHRKLVKCLRKLGVDPKQSGLNSPKYSSMTGPNGEEVWESDVENKTPAAWRVFWCYGPEGPVLKGPCPGSLGTITVVAITPHP